MGLEVFTNMITVATAVAASPFLGPYYQYKSMKEQKKAQNEQRASNAAEAAREQRQQIKFDAVVFIAEPISYISSSEAILDPLRQIFAAFFTLAQESDQISHNFGIS